MKLLTDTTLRGRLLLLLLLVVCLAARRGSAQYEAEERHPAGFFNLFMRPIRTTIEQAKSYLGRRADGLQEGAEALRRQTYEMFMQAYNKSYSAEEIPKRMQLFFERKQMIDESVRDFNEGRSLFTMRENPFIDWDEEEKRRLTGVALPSRRELAREEAETALVRGKRALVAQQGRNEWLPASVDWRESGCVSTPINQMKCGACYAIATMSVLESMRCINQVSSPTLSPQQIVDCATPRAGYENYGCDGGWPTRVLKYLQNTGVAARETCYPFVRRQNSCKLSSVRAVQGCTVPASPSNAKLTYKVLNNERDIMHHVAKTGPVVTVMRASDKFLYYGRGIFDDASCSRKRDDVDHAIVIVGYGSENGVKYWIIKNSWGVREWGENGYGKYKRGTNACSIGHWGWVVSS